MNKQEIPEHILWLKDRQKGIGGSDVGAILGVNPYKTAYDVWQEKIAPEPIQIEDNEAMKAGRMLEDAVARWFAEETGFGIIAPDNHSHFVGEKSYYHANVDRLIETPEGRGVLECKTASGYSSDNWDAEVPLTYYLQLMHYMNVLDLDFGYIAVLIDGRDFRYFLFERDQELIKRMEKKLDEFWQHVQDGTPPPAQKVGDIVKQYPQDTGEDVIAVSHVEVEIEHLNELRAKIKELEQEADKAEFIIKEYIGEASTLRSGAGKILATWKASKPTKRFDSASFKTENPDMFEKYQKETAGSRRFLLKGDKK